MRGTCSITHVHTCTAPDTDIDQMAEESASGDDSPVTVPQWEALKECLEELLQESPTIQQILAVAAARIDKDAEDGVSGAGTINGKLPWYSGFQRPCNFL